MLLMPRSGGAIQAATLPGSYTGCISDCTNARSSGVGRELTLPSTRFRRSIGAWAGVHVTLESRIVSGEEWDRGIDAWLPTEGDRAFVQSLMQQVVEPGKMAAWIAPPDRGINNLALDYEYVHLQ